MSRKEDFLKKAGITKVISREQLFQVAKYYDNDLDEYDKRFSFFPSGTNKVGLMYCHENGINPKALYFKSEEAAKEFRNDFEQEIFKYLW